MPENLNLIAVEKTNRERLLIGVFAKNQGEQKKRGDSLAQCCRSPVTEDIVFNVVVDANLCIRGD